MATPENHDVTQLLKAWSAGDPEALHQLVPLVADDLRRMAGVRMAREAEGHTLEPTAVVNELYLKLVGKRTVHWESRTQFFATMAEVIRRILVDHARHRKAIKQGGDVQRVTFEKAFDVPAAGSESRDVDLLALDEALSRLAEMDPRQAQIVELRYFADLTLAQTAQILDVSTMTVKREWRTARLWLLQQLGEA
jgi:RNA polymerase sigma-70 factor (ECF subfamily)